MEIWSGSVTSSRQADANRKNAQRSTGPRSDVGKAAVRLNAMTHGLLAQQAVLPDEDAAAFAEFASRLRANLQPVGELEELHVELMTAAVWRLRRWLRIEVELFHEDPLDVIIGGEGIGPAFKRDSFGANAFSKLSRYEAGIERSFYRALHELQRLQTARHGGQVAAPVALDVSVAVTDDRDTEHGFVSQNDPGAPD